MRFQLMAGTTAGLAWGLASVFRPNALPVVLLAALLLGAHWLFRRRDARWGVLLGLGVGLTVALAPFADRCSELSGKFCPVSVNSAMNVALGHAGAVKGVRFAPPVDGPPGPTSWFPPALLHHRFSDVGEVPASIYDTRALAGWVMQRFWEHPVDFVLGSIGNAFDLFRFEYWPDNYGGVPQRSATVAKQAFFLVVLAPALVAFAWQLGRLLRRRLRPQAAFITLSVVSLLVVAAISMGEARYRIPFDGLFIILAAHLYVSKKRALRAPRCAPVRSVGWAGATAVPLLASLAGLAAIAHPATEALAAGRSRPTALRVGRTVMQSDVPVTTIAGKPWNAKEHHVFKCRPNCRELRVDLSRSRSDRIVRLGVDHNDWYRLSFYRSGEPIDYVDVAPGGGDGIRMRHANVPTAAREAGYDEVGVMPLYGDGRYALAAFDLIE
jgi:hypothetical protein